MRLTQTQILAIVIGVLTGLTGMTGQLTTLFGPTTTAVVLAAGSIIVMALSVVLTVTTGQAAQVKTVLADPTAQGQLVRGVLAMPGVQGMTVNAKAAPQLAQVAIDPAEDKIAPTPEAASAVTATAKAA